jgi:hypothetical protein
MDRSLSAATRTQSTTASPFQLSEADSGRRRSTHNQLGLQSFHAEYSLTQNNRVTAIATFASGYPEGPDLKCLDLIFIAINRASLIMASATSNDYARKEIVPSATLTSRSGALNLFSPIQIFSKNNVRPGERRASAPRFGNYTLGNDHGTVWSVLTTANFIFDRRAPVLRARPIRYSFGISAGIST